MTQGDFKKLRLKKSELRTIRPEVFAVASSKDPSMGRAALVATEVNRGTVMVFLSEETLSDFGMSALGAIQLAQKPVDKSRNATHEVVARLIPIDRIQVLNATEANAPAGHSVLELYIGMVPFRFSAPAEMLRLALNTAAENPTPNRTSQ